MTNKYLVVGFVGLLSCVCLCPSAPPPPPSTIFLRPRPRSLDDRIVPSPGPAPPSGTTTRAARKRDRKKGGWADLLPTHTWHRRPARCCREGRRPEGTGTASGAGDQAEAEKRDGGGPWTGGRCRPRGRLPRAARRGDAEAWAEVPWARPGPSPWRRRSRGPSRIHRSIRIRSIRRPPPDRCSASQSTRGSSR
jgi:hypothetical protein